MVAIVFSVRISPHGGYIRADLPLVTDLGGYIRAGVIVERGLYTGFYSTRSITIRIIVAKRKTQGTELLL